MTLQTVNFGNLIGPPIANKRGAYNSGAAYVVDDLVGSGGSQYICVAPTAGNEPPNASYWELFLSVGGLGAGGDGSGDMSNSENLDLLANKQTSRDNLDVHSRGEVAALTSGLRNGIINGAFETSPRGDVFNSIANGARFFPGMKWVNNTGTGDVNITRPRHVLGQTGLQGRPDRHMLINQFVAGSGSAYIQFAILGVREFSGITSTVSADVYSSDSRTLDTWNIYQNFGTGGSPSLGTATTMSGFLLAAGWNRVQFVINIPSVAGKTLGTNGDDTLFFRINFDLGDVRQLGIGELSLVKGDMTDVANPYGFINKPLQKSMVDFTLQTHEASGLAAELAHSMRTTPTQSGSGPYTYSAEQ